LATADAFIRSGTYKRILLSCAEVQHIALDFSTRGRDTAVLFGDGAGALVIEAESVANLPQVSNKQRGIIDSILGADGQGIESLCMKVPGTHRHEFINQADVDNRTFRPHMDGKSVFKNAVTKLCESTLMMCQRHNVSPADIHLLVPHQANLRINEMVREYLKISPEKVVNNIHKYGNTTAATIPICLSEAEADGRLKRGDLILTMAFGAGFTWGCNLIRW
jgi:3-oxoacyl-[acyl-carrier-protein] synthase-3